MKNHIFLTFSSFLVLLFSNVCQAKLEDAPWPMYQHDIHHTGGVRHPGLLGGVTEPPREGATDIIYIGSLDGNLYAVDSDGQTKWHFQAGGGIHTSLALGMDGTIYAGAEDNKLYAISPEGKLRWTFDTGWPIFNSPTVAGDGTIYIAGNDILYAVNPDGKQKWKVRMEDSIYSAPTIDSEGRIYVGSDDFRLYALDPDGGLLWHFNAHDWIRSSPIIGADDSIYFGSSDGTFYAVDTEGQLKWKTSTEWQIFSTPALGNDGTLYVTSQDGSIYAISGEGKLKWQYATEDMIESSPIIAEDGTVIVGSNDRKLYAINPDGTLKWTFEAADAIRSSPAIGTDGTIYVGSTDSRLYAISPDGKQKWALTTGSWIIGAPSVLCQSALLAQQEEYKKRILQVYMIHVEYDLYEDGELVRSDIAEVNPELLSEGFRKSIIRKIELLLLDRVGEQGAVAEGELAAPELEILEEELVKGVQEMNVPGTETVEAGKTPAGQGEKAKNITVEVYTIHVEYDLYEGGELVRSEIAEVNPELFSEGFRKSIIQKMEHLLLDRIRKQGAAAEAELAARELEILEEELVKGIQEKTDTPGARKEQ